MFEKKDEIEAIDSAETIVGASVKLKGTLKSEGNIRINGSISGEVQTKGSVHIGAGAEVRAHIKAKNSIISGIVQGNIYVEDQLAITETGKVYGDIQATILSIAPGALFTGKSSMPEEEKVSTLEPVSETEEIEQISEDLEPAYAKGTDEPVVEIEE